MQEKTAPAIMGEKALFATLASQHLGKILVWFVVLCNNPVDAIRAKRVFGLKNAGVDVE